MHRDRPSMKSQWGIADIQSQVTESEGSIVGALWGEVKGWTWQGGVSATPGGWGTQEGDLREMSRVFGTPNNFMEPWKC